MRRAGPLHALAAVLAGAGIAAACEPCAEILDLRQTASRADLIVIARSPRVPVKNPRQDSGPGQYEVRIERVVKGALAEKKIAVLGWQAMCPYGITDWTAKRQILFLVRPPEGETRWHTVNYGCAQKAFELRGAVVVVEENRVPLGDFIKSLGLP